MHRFGIVIGKLSGTAVTPQPMSNTHANIPRRFPGVHRFHDNDGLLYTAARGFTVDEDSGGGGGSERTACTATTKKQ